MVGSSKRLPYVLILPALICIVVVMAFPIAMAAYRSLFEISPFLPEDSFVGLRNYAEIFTDGSFWTAALRTAIYCVGVSVLGITLAAAFAFTLNRMIGGLRIVRGLIILPYIISAVAVAVMFRLLFNTRTGLPNQIIEAFGGEGLPWLAEPSLAMFVIIVAQVWSDLPLPILLIFGGLQTIDGSYLDAALVDGATGWTRAWYITLPLLAPQIALSGLFMSYRAVTTLGSILTLTGGGPAGATETLPLLLYQTGFREFDTGRAMALAIVIFLINAGLALGYRGMQLRFGGGER